MKKEIKYIELKSGFSHSGPAWIAEVELSKSGTTIYFNDSAFKKLRTPGINSNHYDIETGEEYWISGIKKNGSDRHLYGAGKVMIDHVIVVEYLKLIKAKVLDKKKYELVELNKEFDKSRFNKLENTRVNSEEIKFPDHTAWYWDKNRRKLVLQ